MQRINFTQLLVAAITLTVVFYMGISYQGGSPNGTSMTMTSDLADEGLTLRQPLLPKDEQPSRIGQSDLSTNQNTDQRLVRAPALQLPEVQMPSVELNGERGVRRVQPLIVEPDFSRFLSGHPEEPKLAPLDGGASPSDELEQAPPSPWGQSTQQNGLQANQAFRPLLPPEPNPGGNSWLTPDITELNPRIRQPQSHRQQVQNDRPALKNLASLTSIAGNSSMGEPTHIQSFRVHVVSQGETLQGIAKRYYHREDPYLEIYVANQDVLSSPINLPVGITIKIPDL